MIKVTRTVQDCNQGYANLTGCPKGNYCVKFCNSGAVGAIAANEMGMLRKSAPLVTHIPSSRRNFMQPPRPPGRIRPKVSTMPRQQSEAAHYLDIYKLTIEKKRLQQELLSLDQRRRQIQDRVATLESQIVNLEEGAHHLREPEASAQPTSTVYPPMRATERPLAGDFRTFMLEY